MLNLEHLRTLNALARHGSVTRAAAGLHITTSAVSQQLARLERDVNQSLLAKQGRGVRLTDAGRLLAERAAEIIAAVERAQSELEARRGLAVGELNVAAFPTAARGLLPDALVELGSRHPQLRARLEELEPHEIVPRVVRGDLDLAVVNDWESQRLVLPEGVSRQMLLEDPTDLAMPAAHPLADQPEVKLEDFADDDWVVWPEGEYCHEWLMLTLRGAGIEPRVLHVAGEHHTQLALVAAGQGICVTPRLGRGPVPAGVRVAPVHATMHRNIFAIWRADSDRRPSIHAGLDALRVAAGRVGVIWPN
jgi:DNA-binding transcriptional LysR family regulator